MSTNISHGSMSIRRRIALAVVAGAACAGIGIGTPALAQAAPADTTEDKAASDKAVEIGGWNNGDGTSTFYRIETDGSGNVISVRVWTSVNPA